MLVEEGVVFMGGAAVAVLSVGFQLQGLAMSEDVTPHCI